MFNRIVCLNDPVGWLDPTGWASFGSCFAKCAADQFGITTLLSAAGVGAGLPLIPTRSKFMGATPGTSVASKYLSKMFPKRLSRRLWAPTLKNPLAKSVVLGRVLGRWAPILGWGLLAYDVVSIGKCVDDCMKEPADPCK